MGQFFSDLFKDSSEEVKKELEILQEMAQSIIEAQSQRMEAKAYEDKNLPIAAIVDTVNFCHVKATSGVGEGVSKAVDSLFDGKFMDGFKNIVTTALDTFLGNAKAGKQEMTTFHVVYDKNSLLRVDLYFYYYDFSSQAIKEHCQDMLCTVAQVAVLNTLAVDPVVTLYEVTKSIGKITDSVKENFIAECDYVETMKKSLEKLKHKSGE